MEHKEYRVCVSGWENPRTVIEKQESVAMEIALAHDHCLTCARRVREVNAELSRRNILGNWVYPRGATAFIEIPAPPPGVSARGHLGQALGLVIY